MGPTKAHTGATPHMLTGRLRRLRPYLPTLIAFVVILGAAIYAEEQHRLTHQHESRSAVQVEAGLIRSQLEGMLNADIELVRGLSAALSTEPDMDQTRFSALAARVIGTRAEVISLSVAPDMVITLLHPPDPNRAAMGLDFNHIPTQRAAAYRARDTGKPVLAGPVDLVQGGRGFILRFPIFTTSREGRHFQGLLSAVLDIDTLYAATGISAADTGVELALIGRDGTGAEGEQFYGDPAILMDRPVLIDVTLPVGSWQIAARPRGGWSPDPKTLWRNRLLYLAAGFLILCPTFLAGRLSEKRLEVIAQLEARESELGRLSLVARHATDSIVLTDPQTNVTWVNDAFLRLTEYTRDEAIGATLTELLSGPDTDMDTVAAINDHKARGLPFQAEILNYTKSGKPIWVETHTVPILDATGKVTMIIGVERDITHTKAHARELAEAKQAAEQADRAKSEFLANMSHEIRTPMNGIVGMADLLAEADLPDEHRQFVDIIRTSAHALLTIINDILDLSRLQSGQPVLSPQDFDLTECINSAVDILRPRARQKGLGVRIDLSPTLPRRVHADDGRLRQILVNLLGNAVKFTSEGEVRVRVMTVGDDPWHLAIEVEDTGIGISPEQAKRIFDRFSQADAATTRKFGGTGLGLTISTALAELMGGGISLRSAPNQGSCFRVEIRTAPAEGTTARTTHSEALWSGTLAGATILLAEDNRTNRLLIRKYLNGQDVELIEAENGHEAVHLCRDLAPDLILMDMSMPELDGIEATRRIRALEIAQPVIIALTANAFSSDRQACLNAGMNDFLSKPINRTHLLQTLTCNLVKASPDTRPRQSA